MGWNDPGKGPGPWGRKDASHVLDLDALVLRLWRRMRRPSGAPPRWAVAVALVAALGGWFLSGFYSVPSGSRGVLVRLGEPVRVVGPGAHWRWPAPIANDRVVSIRRVHVVAVGYQSRAAFYEGQPAPPPARMLTANHDIVHLEFAVQYRVADPNAYLFGADHPRQTLQRLAEAIMRSAVAKTRASVALSDPRVLETATANGLARALPSYHLGVRVVSVRLQKASEPKIVMAALQKVARAREDARKERARARAYGEAVIAKARASAEKRLEHARAQALATVTRARAWVGRFQALAQVYRSAPRATRDVLYTHTLERVYRKARHIVVSGVPTTVSIAGPRRAPPLAPAPGKRPTRP